MRGVGADAPVGPKWFSVSRDRKAGGLISKRGYLQVRDPKSLLPQTKQFTLRFPFVLLVALICFASSAFAQQATIVGTVTDPSGAVILNVAVSITNTDTGLNRVYPTNEAGQYVAVDLQIGHYGIKATAAGFKAAEQKSIVLTVGDRIRVDFQMQDRK